ncbi:unnamed protein product [Calypogeia fissa]
MHAVYQTSSPEPHPLCESFRDLWAALGQGMQTDSWRRRGLLFQDQLLANFREMSTRKHKCIPSVDEYIASRRDTSGVFPCSVYVELVDKVHVPDEVFDSPEMQRFLVAANDVITWHNDIWSFQKEALIGDVHNLVIVISHARHCSYEEAGAQVYQMVLGKLAEMEEAISDVEKMTPPEHQHGVSRYFHWAPNFVAGTHIWHENCRRYIKCA